MISAHCATQKRLVCLDLKKYDWKLSLLLILFHVQAENNQAAAGSLFSYNMHRHMERPTHTHTHTKKSTHSWSWIILLWIQFSKWKLSKEDTTLQLNQQDSASKLCVNVCLCLLWSVILLHFSCGGNLTADMLIAAHGKTTVWVSVCVCLCVWVTGAERKWHLGGQEVTCISNGMKQNWWPDSQTPCLCVCFM